MKKNKKQIAEQKKEYYEQNKDKLLEYQKEYHEQNKEKIAEHKKQYSEQNKDHTAGFFKVDGNNCFFNGISQLSCFAGEVWNQEVSSA